MNTDNTKEAAIDHTNWMTRDEILSWAQQYFDGQWINAGALETEAGKFADVVAYHAYRAGYTAASAEREWVPVESEASLPKKAGYCWLQLADNVIQLGWYLERKRVFVSPDGGEGYDPIAYIEIPIPQPYTIKGETR